MSAGSENLRNNQEQMDADGCMVKVSRQAVDETLAEYDRMLAALTNIADGNIPREMLEQWQGLSEEAWYEQRGEYLQNMAQAIVRPEPVSS